MEKTDNRGRILGLLRALRELAMTLPEGKREAFLSSDARMSLDYLINRLEGRRGLREDIAARRGSALSPGRVASALAYLERLALTLPDRPLAEAMSRKAETVIEDLEAALPASLQRSAA